MYWTASGLNFLAIAHYDIKKTRRRGYCVAGDGNGRNWRLMALEPDALMEAEGVIAFENDRPLFIADLIRV
jgi:hypothetical protein